MIHFILTASPIDLLIMYWITYFIIRYWGNILLLMEAVYYLFIFLFFVTLCSIEEFFKNKSN